MSPKLAICGGEPVSSKPDMPKWPIHSDIELNNVRDVLESSMWSRTPGKSKKNPQSDKIQQFEENFCKFLGAKHGVAVTNGTAALELSCRALSLEPGDEIITPAYSFVSSATSIFAARCIPVFVDLDPETLLISPDRIEEAITPRTRAIVAVHLDGYACDMDRIMEIAKKHNLYVIEDCARAPGAEWRGQKVGTIGHFGCFSYWTSKHMSAGEGGFISSNHSELFNVASGIMNQGRMQNEDFYQHDIWGGNYRMSQVQAAVLLGQLSRYPEQIEHRENVVAHLGKLLEGKKGLRLVKRDPRQTKLVYYFMLLHYDAAEFGGVPLELFSKAMGAEGAPLQENFNRPLSENPIFSAEGLKASKLDFIFRDYGRVIDYANLRFPVVEGNSTLRRQHRHLLAPKEEMDVLVQAMEKIRANVDELVEYANGNANVAVK